MRALMCLFACVAFVPPLSAQKKGPEQRGKVETKPATQEEKDAAAVGGFACLGFTGVMLIVFAGGSLLVYLLPTMIAVLRSHPNTGPIVVVNLFLGWSLIGWVVALAWAFTTQERPRYRRPHYD